MEQEQRLSELQARELIDQKLIQAGWILQDKKRLNLYESLGIAVREMDTSTGPADYMLFVGGKACGIIEAKKEGTNLGNVAEQSGRYAKSHTSFIQRAAANDEPLPFLYESTNHEIRFRDERDPNPRSRYVFHFHKPETLKEWLEAGETIRDRLQHLPELNIENLRACQIDAIQGIEDIEESLLLNQRIARLRPYLSEFSRYISLFLQSKEFRDEFFSYETGNVGQGNVGMKAVTEVLIRLCSR